MNGTFTKDEEVANPKHCPPHLVILGAGASRAAFPQGDRNGRILPLMQDFISVLNLEPLFTEHGYDIKQQNIEDVYDDICTTAPASALRSELESSIFNYFASLELPDNPTIYDYLVLSLRPKDFIATFNWDPFLVQAVQRNGEHAKPPELLFLHGNVAVGHCMKCKCMGVYDWPCPRCGGRYERSKLLYPISQKNYSSDPFIFTQWKTLQDVLNVAPMVTIYGYGAPPSDVEAINLFKEGWGASRDREMEQIEMINKLSEKELCRTWDPFIHSDHYQYTGDFFTSWIAKHPRRTVEAYFAQHWEARFTQTNIPTHSPSLTDLWEWYGNLVAREDDSTQQT